MNNLKTRKQRQSRLESTEALTSSGRDGRGEAVLQAEVPTVVSERKTSLATRKRKVGAVLEEEQESAAGGTAAIQNDVQDGNRGLPSNVPEGGSEVDLTAGSRQAAMRSSDLRAATHQRGSKGSMAGAMERARDSEIDRPAENNINQGISGREVEVVYEEKKGKRKVLGQRVRKSGNEKGGDAVSDHSRAAVVDNPTSRHVNHKKMRKSASILTDGQNIEDSVNLAGRLTRGALTKGMAELGTDRETGTVHMIKRKQFKLKGKANAQIIAERQSATEKVLFIPEEESAKADAPANSEVETAKGPNVDIPINDSKLGSSNQTAVFGLELDTKSIASLGTPPDASAFNQVLLQPEPKLSTPTELRKNKKSTSEVHVVKESRDRLSKTKFSRITRGMKVTGLDPTGRSEASPSLGEDRKCGSNIDEPAHQAAVPIAVDQTVVPMTFDLRSVPMTAAKTAIMQLRNHKKVGGAANLNAAERPRKRFKKKLDRPPADTLQKDVDMAKASDALLENRTATGIEGMGAIDAASSVSQVNRTEPDRKGNSSLDREEQNGAGTQLSSAKGVHTRRSKISYASQIESGSLTLVLGHSMKPIRGRVKKTNDEKDTSHPEECTEGNGRKGGGLGRLKKRGKKKLDPGGLLNSEGRLEKSSVESVLDKKASEARRNGLQDEESHQCNRVGLSGNLGPGPSSEVQVQLGKQKIGVQSGEGVTSEAIGKGQDPPIELAQTRDNTGVKKSVSLAKTDGGSQQSDDHHLAPKNLRDETVNVQREKLEAMMPREAASQAKGVLTRGRKAHGRKYSGPANGSTSTKVRRRFDIGKWKKDRKKVGTGGVLKSSKSRFEGRSVDSAQGKVSEPGSNALQYEQTHQCTQVEESRRVGLGPSSEVQTGLEEDRVEVHSVGTEMAVGRLEQPSELHGPANGSTTTKVRRRFDVGRWEKGRKKVGTGGVLKNSKSRFERRSVDSAQGKASELGSNALQNEQTHQCTQVEESGRVGLGPSSEVETGVEEDRVEVRPVGTEMVSGRLEQPSELHGLGCEQKTGVEKPVKLAERDGGGEHIDDPDLVFRKLPDEGLKHSETVILRKLPEKTTVYSLRARMVDGQSRTEPEMASELQPLVSGNSDQFSKGRRKKKSDVGKVHGSASKYIRKVQTRSHLGSSKEGGTKVVGFRGLSTNPEDQGEKSEIAAVPGNMTSQVGRSDLQDEGTYERATAEASILISPEANKMQMELREQRIKGGTSKATGSIGKLTELQGEGSGEEKGIELPAKLAEKEGGCPESDHHCQALEELNVETQGVEEGKNFELVNSRKNPAKKTGRKGFVRAHRGVMPVKDTSLVKSSMRSTNVEMEKVSEDAGKCVEMAGKRKRRKQGMGTQHSPEVANSVSPPSVDVTSISPEFADKTSAGSKGRGGRRKIVKTVIATDLQPSLEKSDLGLPIGDGDVPSPEVTDKTSEGRKGRRGRKIIEKAVIATDLQPSLENTDIGLRKEDGDVPSPEVTGKATEGSEGRRGRKIIEKAVMATDLQPSLENTDIGLRKEDGDVPSPEVTGKATEGSEGRRGRKIIEKAVMATDLQPSLENTDIGLRKEDGDVPSPEVTGKATEGSEGRRGRKIIEKAVMATDFQPSLENTDIGLRKEDGDVPSPEVTGKATEGSEGRRGRKIIEKAVMATDLQPSLENTNIGLRKEGGDLPSPKVTGKTSEGSKGRRGRKVIVKAVMATDLQPSLANTDIGLRKEDGDVPSPELTDKTSAGSKGRRGRTKIVKAVMATDLQPSLENTDIGLRIEDEDLPKEPGQGISCNGDFEGQEKPSEEFPVPKRRKVDMPLNVTPASIDADGKSKAIPEIGHFMENDLSLSSGERVDAGVVESEGFVGQAGLLDDVVELATEGSRVGVPIQEGDVHKASDHEGQQKLPQGLPADGSSSKEIPGEVNVKDLSLEEGVTADPAHVDVVEKRAATLNGAVDVTQNAPQVGAELNLQSSGALGGIGCGQVPLKKKKLWRKKNYRLGVAFQRVTRGKSVYDIESQGDKNGTVAEAVNRQHGEISAEGVVFKAENGRDSAHVEETDVEKEDLEQGEKSPHVPELLDKCVTASIIGALSNEAEESLDHNRGENASMAAKVSDELVESCQASHERRFGSKGDVAVMAIEQEKDLEVTEIQKSLVSESPRKDICALQEVEKGEEPTSNSSSLRNHLEESKTPLQMIFNAQQHDQPAQSMESLLSGQQKNDVLSEHPDSPDGPFSLEGGRSYCGRGQASGPIDGGLNPEVSHSTNLGKICAQDLSQIRTAHRADSIHTLDKSESLTWVETLDPFAKIVESDPVAPIAESDPVASTVESDPFASIIESDHAASGVESEPFATIVESGPAASRVESDPAASRVESDPAASRVESDPAASRVESDPAASRVESDPAASRVELDPAASGVELDPAASIVESDHAASGVESDPAASGVESDPAASGVESDPAASGVESDPAASGVESDPAASRIESDPVASKVESDPVASVVESVPVATIVESGPVATMVESGSVASIVESGPVATIVESNPITIAEGLEHMITPGNSTADMPNSVTTENMSESITAVGKPECVTAVTDSDSVTALDKSSCVSVADKVASVATIVESDPITNAEGLEPMITPDSSTAHDMPTSITTEKMLESITAVGKPECVAVVNDSDSVTTLDKSSSVSVADQVASTATGGNSSVPLGVIDAENTEVCEIGSARESTVSSTEDESAGGESLITEAMTSQQEQFAVEVLLRDFGLKDDNSTKSPLLQLASPAEVLVEPITGNGDESGVTLENHGMQQVKSTAQTPGGEVNHEYCSQHSGMCDANLDTLHGSDDQTTSQERYQSATPSTEDLGQHVPTVKDSDCTVDSDGFSGLQKTLEREDLEQKLQGNAVDIVQPGQPGQVEDSVRQPMSDVEDPLQDTSVQSEPSTSPGGRTCVEEVPSEYPQLELADQKCTVESSDVVRLESSEADRTPPEGSRGRFEDYLDVSTEKVLAICSPESIAVAMDINKANDDSPISSVEDVLVDNDPHQEKLSSGLENSHQPESEGHEPDEPILKTDDVECEGGIEVNAEVQEVHIEADDIHTEAKQVQSKAEEMVAETERVNAEAKEVNLKAQDVSRVVEMRQNVQAKGHQVEAEVQEVQVEVLETQGEVQMVDGGDDSVNGDTKFVNVDAECEELDIGAKEISIVAKEVHSELEDYSEAHEEVDAIAEQEVDAKVKDPLVDVITNTNVHNKERVLGLDNLEAASLQLPHASSNLFPSYNSSVSDEILAVSVPKDDISRPLDSDIPLSSRAKGVIEVTTTDSVPLDTETDTQPAEQVLQDAGQSDLLTSPVEAGGCLEGDVLQAEELSDIQMELHEKEDPKNQPLRSEDPVSQRNTVKGSLVSRKRKGRFGSETTKDMVGHECGDRDENLPARVSSQKKGFLLASTSIESGGMRIRPRPLDPDQSIPILVEGRDKDFYEYDGGSFYRWVQQQEEGRFKKPAVDLTADGGSEGGGSTTVSKTDLVKKRSISIPLFRKLPDDPQTTSRIVTRPEHHVALSSFPRPQAYVRHTKSAARTLGHALGCSFSTVPSAYDMDDEDEEWLQGYNEILEQSGQDQLLSDDTFEELIELFEREFYRISQINNNSAVLPRNLGDKGGASGHRGKRSDAECSQRHSRMEANRDGARFSRSLELFEGALSQKDIERRFALQNGSEDCCICNGGENSDFNPVRRCQICSINVHQSCYGICGTEGNEFDHHSESPNWCCRKCEAVVGGRALPSISCVICCKSGGAMKPTVDPLKWAHVACALYTNETFFVDPEAMEPVDGLAAVEARVKKQPQRCGLCGAREGSCVRCSTRGCRAPFHISCGVSQGASFELRHTKQLVVGVRSFCPRHASFVPGAGDPVELLPAVSTESSDTLEMRHVGQRNTGEKGNGTEDAIMNGAGWQGSFAKKTNLDRSESKRYLRKKRSGARPRVTPSKLDASRRPHEISEKDVHGVSRTLPRSGSMLKENMQGVSQYMDETDPYLHPTAEEKLESEGVSAATSGSSIHLALTFENVDHTGKVTSRGNEVDPVNLVAKEKSVTGDGDTTSPADKAVSDALLLKLPSIESLDTNLATPQIVKAVYSFWQSKRVKAKGSILLDLRQFQAARSQGIFNKVVHRSSELIPAVGHDSPARIQVTRRPRSLGTRDPTVTRFSELRQQLEMLRSIAGNVVRREQLKLEDQKLLYESAQQRLLIAREMPKSRHCVWCENTQSLLSCSSCPKAFCFQCFKHKRGYGVKGWIAASKLALYVCNFCLGSSAQEKSWPESGTNLLPSTFSEPRGTPVSRVALVPGRSGDWNHGLEVRTKPNSGKQVSFLNETTRTGDPPSNPYECSLSTQEAASTLAPGRGKMIHNDQVADGQPAHSKFAVPDTTEGSRAVNRAYHDAVLSSGPNDPDGEESRVQEDRPHGEGKKVKRRRVRVLKKQVETVLRATKRIKKLARSSSFIYGSEDETTVSESDESRTDKKTVKLSDLRDKGAKSQCTNLLEADAEGNNTEKRHPPLKFGIKFSSGKLILRRHGPPQHP